MNLQLDHFSDEPKNYIASSTRVRTCVLCVCTCAWSSRASVFVSLLPLLPFFCCATKRGPDSIHWPKGVAVLTLQQGVGESWAIFLWRARTRGPRRLCVRYSDRGSKAFNLPKLTAAIFLDLCVGCSPARYQLQEKNRRRRAVTRNQKRKKEPRRRVHVHHHAKRGTSIILLILPPNYGCRWLSQRVAMDDLASYFVEERSKVR